MFERLPWGERVTMLEINPDAATLRIEVERQRGIIADGLKRRDALRVEVADQKYLVKEAEAKLKETIRALKKISKHIQCDGPGCPWCEDGTHPPSLEAKIALATLALIPAEEKGGGA